MKIDIKPLVRAIQLREYAEEYDDQAIWCWVNPPRQTRLEHWDIVQDFQAVVDDRKALLEELEKAVESAEKTGDSMPDPDAERVAALDKQIEDIGRRLYGWFATVWSRHQDEATHWTTDDVVDLVEACLDSDPQLWEWIQDRHWELVRDHREGVKKK